MLGDAETPAREGQRALRDERRSGRVWGVLLVVAGVILLLNNLNVIPGQVLDWWPLIVIGGGLWMLGEAVARRRQGTVGGVVLTSLGVFWLLNNLGRVDNAIFLPVLLMALGVGLVLRQVLRTAN
jgi:hypothetical protein